MLNNCPTATKGVYVVSNLWLLSVCLIMVYFCFQFFLRGSAHIVGKLVMHPWVPFRGGALVTFLVHPSVHRAHRLKSTALRSLKR